MTQTRRTLLITATAVSLSGAARAAAPAAIGRVRRLDKALDALIPAGASPQVLGEGYAWAEGPVWVGGAADGALLFTDVPGNVIHRWSAKDGVTEFLKPSGFAGPDASHLREAGANGLTLDAKGQLIVADGGSRTVARLDLATRQKTVLAERYRGKKFNSPNDVVAGPSGAIYFTDPPYGLKDIEASPVRELSFAGVFRLGPDGGVDLIDDSLSLPNGVGVSPNGRTLYVSVSDPKNPVIMAYDLGPDGLPRGKRVFFDARPLMTGGAAGLPDGLSVDARGTLFASGPGGLLVIDPKGKLLGVIETGKAISNCAFAPDGTLYLTSSDKIARIRTTTRGL